MPNYSLKKTKLILGFLLLLSVTASFMPVLALKLNFVPVVEKIDANNKKNTQYFKEVYDILLVSKLADRIYHSGASDQSSLNLWAKKTSEINIHDPQLKAIFDEETKNFQQAFTLIREVGVKDQGKIGELRSYIHSLEKSVKSKKKLYIQLLKIRRYEKDFLIREEPKYRELLINEISSLRGKLKSHEKNILKKYEICFEEIYFKVMAKKEFFFKGNFESERILELINIRQQDRESKYLSVLGIMKDFELNLIMIIIAAMLSITGCILYIFRVVSVEDGKKVQLIKKIEQDLREKVSLQEQLVAKEKLSSLGVLSAGIAHEIRNPLSLIAGASTTVEGLVDEMVGKTAEERDRLTCMKETIHIITESAERANTIITNMLSISSGSKKELEVFDLGESIIETHKLAFHSMRAVSPFNYEIVQEIPLGFLLRGFKSDISRAIINILDNAFYALKERQQVAGESYKPYLNISLIDLGDHYKISFEDNGIGIPKSKIKNIADPFFTTKPIGEGTGLGMHFVHDMAVEHKGRLIIDSVEGDYTLITLTLSKEIVV